MVLVLRSLGPEYVVRDKAAEILTELRAPHRRKCQGIALVRN